MNEGAQSGGGYGRSVLVSVATVATMSAMALANNVAIARLAGPEARGLYGVVVAIGALAVPAASMGLGPAATWQLGKRADSEPAQLGRIVAHLRRVVLLSLALGMGLGALALGVRGFAPTPTHATLLAVGCAALTLPAQVTNELGRGVALGRRRALTYNLLAVAVLAGLLTLNLLTAQRGPAQVLVNLGAANWIVALAVMVRGSSLARAPQKAEDPGPLDALRAYGARATLVALGDAALLRADYLLAAPIIGLTKLGIYAIADQISHLMAMVGLLAGKMMLPESAADSEGGRSLAKLGLACRLLVLALSLGSLVAIAVGPWLIPALFGPEFAPAYAAMLILLPAALLKGLSALISTWLAGRGVQRPTVRAGALALAAQALGVVALGLSLGWLGVAIAKTLGYLVQFVAVLRALERHRPGAAAALGWRPRLDDLRALSRWLVARLGR